MRDLREKLDKQLKSYIVSILLPPAGVDIWEMGYDLDEIIDHIDFMNVYSMDYSGPWDNKWGTPTGPSAPMNYNIGPRKHFTVDWTMKYYACKTRQPNKFNIVIPFYARIWRSVGEAITLKTEVFRNAKLINGKADGDPYISRLSVKQKGIELFPYSWDNATKSSYIWKPKEKTFLTFENERSIEKKLQYVNEMNLGGVWIWSVDMDDRINTLLDAVSSDKFCSSSSANSINFKF